MSTTMYDKFGCIVRSKKTGRIGMIVCECKETGSVQVLEKYFHSHM